MSEAVSEAALSIEVACEHCHKQAGHGQPFLEMQGGKRDGAPWYLCPRCWLEGATRSGATAAAIVERTGSSANTRAGKDGSH